MDKFNKTIIIMISIIAVLISIVSAMIIYRPSKNEQTGEKVETEVSKETILDECTEEYEQLQQEIIATNSNKEKISPNCQITLTKYYKKCGDTINDYLQVPERLVNVSQDELQKEYSGWKIKEFSSNKIVLYKEFDEECGEHYILKNENGKIIIYKILEDGREELYEKTEVSIDYLPQKDRESVKQGLKVNGRERLNEIIESFE